MGTVAPLYTDTHRHTRTGARTHPVAYTPAGCQISRLFVTDQCSVINRGGTLLAFNGIPPTWVACLAESEVDSPKWSVINSDRHVS